MLARRVFALVTVLALLLGVTGAGVRAQYTEGLPPGVVSVEVDGQPIDAFTVPVTSSATPEVSGRVDLGVATIELAVANGSVVRFSADVDNRGRFRGTVPESLADGQYALYINDVLIGAFTVEGAEPERRQGGRLLDIARVVPYPADFQDALPGLGFLDGRFYTLEEEASRTAGASDGSAAAQRDTQRRLAEAGWLQRYESRLAAPNPDNPQTFTVQISSFAVEYASGADARTAFAALAGDDPGVEFAVVGDESVLTLLTGVTPDTGVEYQAARLVYRAGPFLGMIVYADLLGQQPNVELLQAVAQSVAARASLVADGQTIPLSSMTLRLDPSAATSSVNHRDLYDVRDGALTPLFGEDEATRADRVTLYSGTTDAFSSTVSGTFSPARRERRNQEADTGDAEPSPTSVIAIEGGDGAPADPATAVAQEAPVEATAQVYMVSALYAFPGEGEADAWLASQRERLLNGEAGAGFSEASDGPALGDASMTFATSRPIGTGEATAGGYRIYTRVGFIVAALEIGSLPDAPLAAATSLMEEQVACITDGGCRQMARLPNTLFGNAPAAATTPQAEEAPAEPTPGSVITIEGEDAESPPADEGTVEPTPASVITIEGEEAE